MTRISVGVLALVALFAQSVQQPVRDVPAPPSTVPALATGTASVAGVVVDDQKQPVRRARVTITSVDRGGTGRTATTDDAGRFDLRNLPSGRYNVQASKRAWLDANYGATRPGRSGTPVAIADGQRLDRLTIAMTRGAVIAGTVHAESGEPISTIAVTAYRFSTQSGVRSLGQAATAQTDDLGAYRFYGLVAGDYVVTAAPRFAFAAVAAEIHQTMPGDVERAVRGGTMNVSASVDYSRVYFPGTTDASSAETLHVAAAEQRVNVDFVIRLAPTVTIHGAIASPPGIGVTTYQLRLLPAGEEFSGVGSLGATARPDKDGRFAIPGVAPGRYTINAAGGAPPGRPGGPGAPPMQLVGYANVDVAVSSQDLDVPITLQPPLVLRGRLVFDGANPPKDAAGVRVSLLMVTDRQLLRGTPLADAPFTLSYPPLPPGKYDVFYSTPPDSSWFVESAIAGGRDVFDAPIDLREDVTDLVVTLTDHPSEIAGRLENTAGHPAPDYFIIVFPADRSLWTPTTRRIQSTRPGNDGAFSLKALPAGDYLIGALTDVEPGEWFTPSFLEQVARAAQKMTVVSGQKVVVNLKLSGGH